MSAFAIYFKPQGAAVAADSLAYLPDRHEVKPLGFINKVLVLPHLKAVMFSRGQYQILTNVWRQLMLSPQVKTIEQAAEAMPAMFRDVSEAYCDSQGIADYRDIAMSEVVLLGWSPAKGRMRFWQFLNHQDYQPLDDNEEHYALFTMPRLPKEYKASPSGPLTKSLITAIEDIGRFFESEPELNCGARVGGEVIITGISPEGIKQSVGVHRFTDYEQTRHAGAALVARIERGDLDLRGVVAAGVVPAEDCVDLVNGDSAAAEAA